MVAFARPERSTCEGCGAEITPTDMAAGNCTQCKLSLRLWSNPVSIIEQLRRILAIYRR